MMKKAKRDFPKEIKELKDRLNEAEELLSAIKSGAVDALITDEQKIFTLKSADHAYRVLVETINEGALTLTFGGTIMYCNQHLAGMLGLPIKKIIGGSIFDFVEPDELPKLKSILLQSKNKTTRAEFQLKKNNKTLLPVLLSCNSLKLEDAGLCMVVTDLTEQKNTADELNKYQEHLEELIEKRTNKLLESEERFKVAVKNASFVVAQCGRDLRYRWISNLHLDFAPSTVLGKRDDELDASEGSRRLLALKRRVLKTGTGAREEISFARKNGVRVYDISIDPIVDDAGNITGLTSGGSDITKLKQAEEILKRDEETLKRLVKEQAHDLIIAQAGLGQAKRLSDIGILAATVAHELRNPLAVIGITAYNIKRKANDPVIDKYVYNINKKVAESDQIINNLLFYSRLKPPQYERINIFNIIKDCAAAVAQQKKKKVTVVKIMDSIKGIMIEAAPLQITEVFNNLLNNALDAIPAKKGRIRIITENEAEFIKVIIEDNGAGIGKNVLDKIFDPFFTTKAKGTGLGLYVCKQIINMHTGEIEVKSKLGHGTSFIVHLPKKENKSAC